MTCLFCRCNTWASKHGLATVKGKKQTRNGLVTRLTLPQPSDLLSPAVIVIINLHIVTSRKDTFPTFYSLSNFPPHSGCSDGACQLLPPQSFINIVSLFIQREQGSATMTTDASDCRPPINTSDTCVWGIKRKTKKTKNGIVYKWETGTVCSQHAG